MNSNTDKLSLLEKSIKKQAEDQFLALCLNSANNIENDLLLRELVIPGTNRALKDLIFAKDYYKEDAFVCTKQKFIQKFEQDLIDNLIDLHCAD